MKRLVTKLGLAATVLLGTTVSAETAKTTAPTQAQDAPACAMRAEPVAIAMRRVAVHSEEDPTGLWTKAAIYNVNTPHKTAVWSGSGALCDGSTITVTQIVNRQCSSPVVCPARVARTTGSERKIVAWYEQICTDPQRIAVRANGTFLSACDVDFPLAQP